jgi:hypothetical protein
MMRLGYWAVAALCVTLGATGAGQPPSVFPIPTFPVHQSRVELLWRLEREESVAEVLRTCERLMHDFGDRSPEVVAALTGVLESGELAGQWKACVLLGRMGPAAGAAADALAGVLAAEVAGRRAAAAEALARIGRAARAALPALESAFQDEDPFVRANARAAAMRIRGDAGDELAALMAMLESGPDADSRDAAAGGLGLAGHMAAGAMPVLVAAADGPPLVANSALMAIGQVGTDPELAVPVLLEAVRQGSDGTAEGADARAFALGSLGAYVGKDDRVVPLLLSEVRSRCSLFASGALATGARHDPAARAAVGELLASADGEQRERTWRSLGAIDAPPPAFLAEAADAVQDPQLATDVLRYVAAVADDPTACEAAVPLLAEGLRSESFDARCVAAQGLSARLPCGHEAAVAALTTGLSDMMDEVVRNCVAALAAWGPDAAPALPELEKLRESYRGSLADMARGSGYMPMDSLVGRTVAVVRGTGSESRADRGGRRQ